MALVVRVRAAAELTQRHSLAPRQRQTTRTFDAASGHVLGISSATASGAAIQSLDYRFDVLGNLMERRDGLQQLKETIGYDTLNRMVSVNTTLPGTNGAQSTAKTVTYDARGNIRWRSDVGWVSMSPSKPQPDAP